MDLEAIREFCLGKKGRITEGLPFGEDVLVFKVNGKMFLLARLTTHPLSVNLKCDPELAVELRDRFQSVTPGHHMSKKYWNTVVLDGTIPAKEIFKMIDHSYEQVVEGFGKSAETNSCIARRNEDNELSERTHITLKEQTWHNLSFR